MKLKDYILVFLYQHLPTQKIPIPSVKFWAITLLVVSAGIEIETNDGHVLTVKDCFVEMEDCASGDCYKKRGKKP